MDRQIEEIEKKAEGIIIEIKRMTKEEEMGKLGTEARLLIHERTSVPFITNNLECWRRIGKKIWRDLRKYMGE